MLFGFRQRPVQLMATEKLSEVYKLKNETFESQCRRQIRMLNLYYGDHLQLSLANVKGSNSTVIAFIK